MNRKQLLALWIGVLACVGAGLFPPFYIHLRGENWSAHVWNWLWREQHPVDLHILFIEWLLIALVTAAAIITLRYPGQSQPGHFL